MVLLIIGTVRQDIWLGQSLICPALSAEVFIYIFFFYCSLTDLYLIGNFHNILYYTFLETDLRSCLLIGFYLQDFSQWYSMYIQSMLWVASLERSFIIKPFWGYPQWQLNRAGGLHGTGAQGVRSLCLIRAYNLKIIQPVFFSWGDDDDDTGLMLETNC